MHAGNIAVRQDELIARHPPHIDLALAERHHNALIRPAEYRELRELMLGRQIETTSVAQGWTLKHDGLRERVMWNGVARLRYVILLHPPHQTV